MIALSRRFILSLVGACTVAFFTGCGGSGDSDNGFAPNPPLDGYVLKLIPGDPVAGLSPGMMVIYETTGEMGAVDIGTQFEAQVTYIKTGENTASVAISLHSPDNTETITTKTYQMAADLVFDAKDTGTITKWEFIYAVAGEGRGVGYGSSGTFTLTRR